MSREVQASTAWLIVAVLSVVSAGAYIGIESAHYFWDLTSYVEALDSAFPYREQRTFPFLYPPFTADVFHLAKSHLFELLTIAYVGAAAFFLRAFAQLAIPRRFEWLFAVTSMGSLGVVSLQSGNLAILMNLPVLALAFQAAMGQSLATQLLPIAIGIGALLKPQFIIYLGLLPFVDRSFRTSAAKMLAVIAAVAGVYGMYVLFRPFDWSEYVNAVSKRMIEGDLGWGPAAFGMRFSDSRVAAYAAYLVALGTVGGLAFATWRRSVSRGQPLPRVALVSLAFVVLTFVNPRVPLYDLHVAAIALAVCCALSGEAVLVWVLAAALAINIVPWTIDEFARIPSAWPWWLKDLQITHLVGLGSLLVALSRAGMARER